MLTDSCIEVLFGGDEIGLMREGNSVAIRAKGLGLKFSSRSILNQGLSSSEGEDGGMDAFAFAFVLGSGVLGTLTSCWFSLFPCKLFRRLAVVSGVSAGEPLFVPCELDGFSTYVSSGESGRRAGAAEAGTLFFPKPGVVKEGREGNLCTVD